MIRLSIILPTYNVENYIERCLRSIENQDLRYSEYEIIVINDGSTDNSRNVVKNLQQSYCNIILKDKVNGGVSSARNYGIIYARGEYIMFCDPDDYIEKNVLGKMLNLVEKDNLDGCCFNIKRINSWGTEIIDKFRFAETEIMDGIAFFRKGYLNGYTHAWLLKKNIVINNNLTFVEGISLAEDQEFLIKFVTLAQKVKYYNLAFYNNVTRKGSLSSSSRKKENIFYVFPLIESLEMFKEEILNNELSKNFIEERIACYYQDAIHFVTYPGFIKYFPLVRDKIKKKRKTRFDIKNFNSKRKKEIALINLSISIYFIYAIFRTNFFLVMAKMKTILKSKK